MGTGHSAARSTSQWSASRGSLRDAHVGDLTDVHVPQGFGSQYQIILQREDPHIALLGNLLHLDLSMPAIASPIAALQRTFLGKFVPLEVFRVNMTALTPERLCSYLTHLNPGKFAWPDMHDSVDHGLSAARAFWRPHQPGCSTPIEYVGCATSSLQASSSARVMAR